MSLPRRRKLRVIEEQLGIRDDGIISIDKIPVQSFPAATTSAGGLVQLDDSVTSSASNTAATANAVRTAFLVATEAKNAVNAIPPASTTARGLVQLDDSLMSSSTDVAATANAVRTAYLVAASALTAIESGNFVSGEAAGGSANAAGWELSNGVIRSIYPTEINVEAFGAQLTFPPVGLTARTTTITDQPGGNGVYIVTASSEWEVSVGFWGFDRLNYTAWVSTAFVYSVSTGLYSGSVTTSGYRGEYLQVQMPTPVIIDQFTIISRNIVNRGDPRDFRLYASNDGLTWTMLFDKVGEPAWALTQTRNYAVSTTTAFRIFRVVANRVHVADGRNTHFIIGDLFFRGRTTILASAVTTTGAIGVNTNAPVEALHVDGNVLVTGQYKGSGAGLTGIPASSLSSTTGNGAVVLSNSSVLNSPVLAGIVNVTGNVGIGIVTPTENLEVGGRIKVGGNNVGAPVNGVGGSAGTRMVLFPGDLTSPPYSIGMDGNTLWYCTGTGANHRWYTGTATTMLMDASGNLGIGTATPSERLHVAGKIKVGSGVAAPADGVSGAASTRIILADGTTSAPPYSLGLDTNAMWYCVPNSAAHRWYTGATNNTMTLDGTGNLGIGTAAPSAKLDVAGDARINGSAVILGDISVPDVLELQAAQERRHPPGNLAANVGSLSGFSYGNGDYLATASSSLGGDPWMAFDNPVLDTHWATPGGTYDSTTGLPSGATFESVAGEWLKIELPNSIVVSKYRIQGRFGIFNGNATASFRSPNEFIIYGSTDGVTWVILDDRRGVNATTPWSEGEVKEFKIPSNTTAYKYYVLQVTRVGNDGSTFRNSVQVHDWRLFETIGETRLEVNAKLGINKAIPTKSLDVVGDVAIQGQFDVVGNAFITGNVTANAIVQTSDARLKTDLQEIQDSMERVRGLTGYTYSLLDDVTAPRRAGLIAQDVETVLPEAVSEIPSTGYKGVLYTDLVALLVQALKEVDGEVRQLRAEVQSLRSAGTA